MGIPDPYKIKNLLEKKISGKGSEKDTVLKVMTPNQMLQRVLIAIAHVKAGNNSQALRNKIRQMVHSLYRGKKISKKLYEDLMRGI